MNERETKHPVAVAEDLNQGVWFRSACSGLWYRNPLSAGSVNGIKIDGRLLNVAGGGCVELESASDERGSRSMQRMVRLRSLRARIAALKKILQNHATTLRRAQAMSDLARTEREYSDLKAQP